MTVRVRCKFRCDSAEQVADGKEFFWNYKFSAVTSGSKENDEFWRWTPAGSLSFQCIRQNDFVVGKEYYLDINLAE